MSGFYDKSQNAILHGGSGFLYVAEGLPAPEALFGLDYVYNAEPFVNVPAKSGIEVTGMDYAHTAKPFVGNE